MKKRISKFFAVSMILAMTLSIAVLSTSCGGTKTLENYVDSNKDVKQQLVDVGAQTSTDQLKSEVLVKENTLTYKFTYTDTYTKQQADQMVAFFEKSMESVSSVYEGVRDDLSKQSEIEDVVVKITYLNGDGSEIYSTTFEKK